MNQIRKGILKNENGSITVFVLAIMLFMLIVVGTSYMSISNKRIAQKKEIEKIQKQYDDASMDEISSKYQEVVMKPTEEKYSITYNANGGTGAPANQKGEYGTAITITNAEPSRPGYRFKGWSTSPTGTINYRKGDKYTENKDITLYAVWEQAENIKFYYYDGTKTATKEVLYEANVEIPSEVKNSTGASGTTYSHIATSKTGTSVTPTGEITEYYVVYTKTVTATKYTYNNQSSTVTGTVYAYYDGETKAASINLGTTTLSGYTFRGWSTANTANATIHVSANSSANLLNNATYYASYTYSIRTSYNVNGGTSTVPTAQSSTGYMNYAGTTVGSSITLPAAATKANYTFEGWYTATSGGTKAGGAGASYTPKASGTLYAQWKANPQVTITTNPSARTVVAGNPMSFSVAATGNGTLTYQWYFNTSNSTTGGTAISGATSATYSTTSSTTQNGRYYYCVVTSTVDSSTARATSTTARLTVQAANYSTVKSNVTTYYNTLSSAVSGATSGGGDTGGGTITVLNSVTDSSSVSTNKSIAINTNGKTVTRTATITTTGGTLTIKGSGTIYANTDINTINSTGGTIATSGSPTIRSLGHAINYASGAGNLNLYGGYIYGEKRGTINYNATGTVLVQNTYVFCPVKNKNAIYLSTSKATTINGSSRVGNGKDNVAGLTASGDGTIAAAVEHRGTGSISVAGTARVLAGQYSGVGVQRKTAGTLSCTDSACIYALNGNCIYFNVAGCTATFNSSGYFYAAGAHVASSGANSATFTVTKGHFVSKTNRYMFYKNNAEVTTNAAASGSATSSRNFSYMNAYNSTATQSIASCYYYAKGV